MTMVYLVRHAHADWQPDEGRSLSPQGLVDAERVADLLADRPIAAIYASPARRAQQTVAPLARRRGLPLQIVADLRERLLSATPVDDFPAAIRAVWSDPDRALAGGESNRTAQRRGVAVLHMLAARHPQQQIALATHGNLLALMLQHFDAGFDFSRWQALTMPDVYHVQLTPDAVTIRRLWS